MSLSFLERLELFVHPDCVIAQRHAWRRQSRSERHGVAAPGAGQPAWQPALETAVALLARAPRGAALRVVVADQFIRYAQLPWSEQFIGQRARLVLAQGILRSTLGERAEDLEIALDRAVFGRDGLAAGIDRNFAAGLRTAARRRQLRFSSLQPRLFAELARHRKKLENGCFVALDAGWLALLEIRDGQVLGLRNHRLAANGDALPLAELSGVLQSLPGRDEAAVPKRLYLAADGALPETLGDWQVVAWPGLFAGAGHA